MSTTDVKIASLAEADEKSGVVDLSEDAMRYANFARVAIVFAQCVMLQHWIGWGWTAAWFAALMVHEIVLVQFVTKRFITPNMLANRQRDAEFAGIVVTIEGTVLHMAGWAAAWIIGGDSFTIIGGMCMCACLLHAQTYMTTWKSLYYASAGPAVLFTFAMPLFLRNSSFPMWILYLTLTIIVAVFTMARLHQGSLEKTIKTIRREWRIAQDANQAKSQFLATMSHELRTPLNAVIGYAEILEETLNDDQRHDDARDAQRIHGAARNLLVLINDILDLSKIEAGKMDMALSPTNVRAIVDDVVHTTAHIAVGNSNQVTIALAFDRDVVVTDQTKLRQCLLNLVSNACKFTQGGAITISGRLDGDALAFDVADTGAGLTDEELGRLFQPFVQLDSSHTRRHGGTGLGLAITRKLANLLGGDVSATSAPGVGSVFSLHIKVAALEERAAPKLVQHAA